ncbi:hypothetical protein MNEG_14680 [Monoraphidium neglectum]|uniref:Uncharacterized protein n=1 Tax=Monoraphidium neglectum TaxID=145388 RepID=A0A0D2IZK8_9CHLO|nr:hypothetical protein MNEG_14680 [Monoraphidium neglectum]KIY93282.1 hypothetical protein MNEG_14680 [Monoraphidium neglectum]|eukprot:XP_013892302.1 hypothetical protein MNEG_14680 [Monoraphidium neglectum]
MVSSEQFARLCATVGPVCDLYDGMHDCPVVAKRRKCQQMAALRDRVMQDPSFRQALQPAVQLRAHIYSLSRRVLLGSGHYDGLPIDLFLGGLSSELAALLKDPSAPGAGASGAPDAAAAAAASSPTGVLDFFSITLPLKQLAVLVFAEFVTVDAQPPAAAAPAGAPPQQQGRQRPPQAGEPMGVRGSGGGSGGGGSGGSARHPSAGGAHAGHDHAAPRRGPPQPQPQQHPPVSLAQAAAAAAAAVKAVACDLARPERGRFGRTST